MSELSVGSLSGLAANSYVVDIASGSSLDLANAKADSLPTSAISTGGILQVVSTAKTDTFTTSSTSYTPITGLSATITPRSTSSKILVLAQISHGFPSGNGYGFFKVTRGGTDIYKGDTAGSRTTGVFGGYSSVDLTIAMESGSIMTLDSPSTTSSITYQAEVVLGGAGTLAYINRSASDNDNAQRGRGASSITLIEVAG